MDIARIHYITQNTAQVNHLQAIEVFCQGNADWVQLRLKDTDPESCLEIARMAKKITDDYGVRLIINDHVELAKTVGAAGVHLGKQDMSPSQARAILGAGFIIGGTANTLDDVKHLVAQSVDYIGYGPFRFTKTKKNLSPVVGLQGYMELVDACRSLQITTPIIAIGGITVQDIDSLMLAGIHGVALSGEVLNASDPVHRTAAITALMREIA